MDSSCKEVGSIPSAPTLYSMESQGEVGRGNYEAKVEARPKAAPKDLLR